MKKEKFFSFTYPLKQKVVRDLKIVTEHVADLIVSGVAYENLHFPKSEPYDRWTADIDYVKYQGVDIRPIMEVTGGMEEIYDAAEKHAATLFEDAQSKVA